jgi:hypothetical protein
MARRPTGTCQRTRWCCPEAQSCTDSHLRSCGRHASLARGCPIDSTRGPQLHCTARNKSDRMILIACCLQRHAILYFETSCALVMLMKWHLGSGKSSQWQRKHTIDGWGEQKSFPNSPILSPSQTLSCLSHPFPLPNPILYLGIPCALVKLME